MATYRQIHTHIWDDPKVEEFSANAKLLFIYSFSNKHRNEAGIYVITIKKMAFETGLTLEQTEAAAKEIIESHRWEYDWDNHILWVKNALKYQSVGGKTLIAIRKDINLISSPLVDQYIEYYKDILYPIDTPSKHIDNPLVTPPGKGNDKGKSNGKDNDKNYSLEIEKFRSRYSPEQLEIIDRYFEILRTTRRSGTMSESIICDVYKDMNKYDPIIVQYACTTVANKPELHDKKENYFAGILRNTTMGEALKGLQGGQRASPNNSNKVAIVDQFFALEGNGSG